MRDGSFEEALGGKEEIRRGVRTKPAQEKTDIGYKTFYRGKDGNLYASVVAFPDERKTFVIFCIIKQ